MLLLLVVLLRLLLRMLLALVLLLVSSCGAYLSLVWHEQDDVLYSALSVYETLYYAAQLRLPNKAYTMEQKHKIVNGLIVLLGLEKCKESQIGKRAHLHASRYLCLLACLLAWVSAVLLLTGPTVLSHMSLAGRRRQQLRSRD